MSGTYIEACVQGRLGGPVTQRQTSNGKPFATLSIAVQSTANDSVEWVQVSVFDALAQSLPEGLAAGERCYVEGKGRVNRWKGKDGQMKSALQVTATRFIALDRIGRRRKNGRTPSTPTTDPTIDPTTALIPF